MSWRGGEQQVNFIFNNQSADFDYYLFCPKGAEIVKRNTEKADHIFVYKKSFGVDVFAAMELKKVCKQQQIDLIHLHDSHAINTYILADFFGMNIPAVIHRHVNFPVYSDWKYNHKKIKKIICVSDVVKNTMLEITDEKKLVTIHPGIDIKKFEHEKISKPEHNKNEFTVGIISALEKEKNIEEFIEIANKLLYKRNNVKFLIIGDGSLFETLKRQHSKTNLEFLGFRNDVNEILKTLDIFLFTSSNEGFGLVLLEAMASKVPIVCSNFPAAYEFNKDKKTVMVYKDVNDAIKKIEFLQTQNEIRTSIVENAYHFVHQFDITLMNKNIEDVYTNLLLK